MILYYDPNMIQLKLNVASWGLFTTQTSFLTQLIHPDWGEDCGISITPSFFPVSVHYKKDAICINEDHGL